MPYFSQSRRLWQTKMEAWQVLISREPVRSMGRGKHAEVVSARSSKLLEKSWAWIYIQDPKCEVTFNRPILWQIEWRARMGLDLKEQKMSDFYNKGKLLPTT